MSACQVSDSECWLPKEGVLWRESCQWKDKGQGLRGESTWMGRKLILRQEKESHDDKRGCGEGIDRGLAERKKA